MTPCDWPIASLLPHADPMILVDAVTSCDSQQVTVTATIGMHHPFATQEGAPIHVGIELMAQTCGAYAGCQAKLSGVPVKTGFLLGTRNFEAVQDRLEAGVCYTITAQVLFMDEEMGVFDGKITYSQAVVATAQLSVYQPKNESGLQMVLART